jgi:DNA-binding transcriptional regulator YiaG
MAQSTLAQPDPHIEHCDRSFGCHLKLIRKRLSGKQVWLSQAIGRTEAAISLWESGARLPNSRSLSRILAVLAQGGASTTELLALRGAWLGERIRRAVLPAEGAARPRPG